MQTGPEEINIDHDSSVDPSYSNVNGSDPSPPIRNGFQSCQTEEPKPLYISKSPSTSKDSECSPAKRRKTGGNTPERTPKPKRISPPWKKFAVDGPSAFVEDGRRKSSRTNNVPLDLQPQADTRQTRSALPSQSSKLKSKYGGASLQEAATLASSPPSSHTKQKAAPFRENANVSTPSRVCSSSTLGQKRAHRKQTSSNIVTTDLAETSYIRGAPQSPYVLKSYRVSHALDNDMPQGKSKKIKVKGYRDHMINEDAPDDTVSTGMKASSFKRPSSDMTMPQSAKIRLRLKMPGNDAQGSVRAPTSRKYGSFQEWLDKEGVIDLGSAETITDLQALKEARIRRRILRAAEPGGLLNEGRSQIFQPEEQEEPPKVYAHWDHLSSQAVYFRKLMDDERRRHQRDAKRLALACQERWKQIQPKTEEDWQTETRASFKQVLRHLHQRWLVASSIVERRRQERWEAEQVHLQKAKLSKALQRHESLIQRRLQGRSESDIDTDTDLSDASSADTDDSNMSESDTDEQDADDGDGNADKELTLEELRLKYAHLHQSSADRSPEPEGQGELIDVDPGGHVDPGTIYIPAELSMEVTDARSNEVKTYQEAFSLDEVADHLFDESDESDDMADDMGSSDGEDDSDDDAAENDGDDESEGEESEKRTLGLLGFFFNRELEMSQAQPASNAEDQMEVVQNAEDIVRNAGEVQTPHSSNGEAPSTERQHRLRDETADEHDKALSPLPKNTASSPLEILANTEHFDDEGSPPATPVSMKAIKTPVPSLLRGTLREYQHYGLDWLAGLYASETNGILADEMGLGKTIQTIALLAHLALEYKIWGPHLVVVPTSVMFNWEMEFKKFLPGFKVLTYHGSAEERKEKRKGWMNNDKWNVMITSYTIALADGHILKRKDWHYMILDEAHNIKNYKSQRWQTLLSFKTRARLLLTGTPLQNNLTELWALLTFLMPEGLSGAGTEGFANLEDFLSWFRRPEKRILSGGATRMDDGDKAIVAKLHKILRPYLLRRLKVDVEKQMPGKYEHREFCRLSKRQRELYDGFLERADTQAAMASGNHMSVINCLMQLRKVCNHPDLFETRQIVTSYAMPRAVSADFESLDYQIHRSMTRNSVDKVDLNFVNLLPGANEPFSALDTLVRERLGALGILRPLSMQRFGRYDHDNVNDPSSIEGTLSSLRHVLRLSNNGRLYNIGYCTSLRSQRRPLFNHSLTTLLSIDHKIRRSPQQPRNRKCLAEGLTQSSSILREMILDLTARSAACDPLLQLFACITPKVTIRRRRALLPSPPAKAQIWPSSTIMLRDPFHHARVRLSIAFSDKRLLQYDCGKLQRLATLLRELQGGGHRALIFTQMTKVLDLLEQFLNIHGYLYLRLDGSTKPEQRQALTEKFNNDPRIFCFILSSRSGGIGLNLAGADTVIFYDQDWNPAMDKQCQDRCHRIGQTRDVHIYRLISQSTIEANILRTADSKQMLDNVVIQEGDFTTDFFQKISVKDMLGDEGAKKIGEKATATLDTALGKSAEGRALQAAEDQEDAMAARDFEKEITKTEVQDLKEGHDQDVISKGTFGQENIVAETSALGGIAKDDLILEQAASDPYYTPAVVDIRIAAIVREERDPHPTPDEYMLRVIEWEKEDVPLDGDMASKKRKRKARKGGNGA